MRTVRLMETWGNIRKKQFRMRENNIIAKRARPKNRMQIIIISPTKLIQHQRDLRELEGIKAKFSFQKCVLGTPTVLESVLGKSSAILVCLSVLIRQLH